MVSLYVFRLFFIIFLGSISLIKRAQSEVFKEENFDKTVGHLRGTFDDGNVQKVVVILKDNIKHWSFIESQLLEPNVNLATPEIFIPLKHLTSTLELLGNILYVKNDFNEAKECLERACPLMELLPASLSDHEHMEDDLLQKAIAMSRTPLKHVEGYKNSDNPHAADCFSLLREVYVKLYEHNDTWNQSELIDNNTAAEQLSLSSSDFSIKNQPLHSVSTSALLGKSVDDLKRVRMSNFDQLSYDDEYSDDDEELDYYIPTSSTPFSIALESVSTSATVNAPVQKNVPSMEQKNVDQHKLTSIRMMKPNSMSRVLSHGTRNLNLPDSATSDLLVNPSRRIKQPRVSTVVDYTSGISVDESVSSQFQNNLDAKFLELRSPFDHLREVASSKVATSSTEGAKADLASNLAFAAVTDAALSAEREAILGLFKHASMKTAADQQFNSADAGVAESSKTLPSELNKHKKVSKKGKPLSIVSTEPGTDFQLFPADLQNIGTIESIESVTDVDILEKLNNIKNQFFMEHAGEFPDHPALIQIPESELNKHGLTGMKIQAQSRNAQSKVEQSKRTSETHQITTQLELLLKKFVKGDAKGKRKTLNAATGYFDELDVNFPQFDYFAYKAHMELGQAFIDLMTRVLEDGVAFIGSELKEWQEAPLFMKFHSTQQAIDLDGLNLRMFDNMRSDDRNYCLALCAFDVALKSASKKPYSSLYNDGFIPYDHGMNVFELFDVATSVASNPLFNTVVSESQLIPGRIKLKTTPQSRKSKPAVGTGTPAPASTTTGKSKKKDKKSATPSVATPLSNTFTSFDTSNKGSVEVEERSSLGTSYTRLEREVTAALYEELLNGNIDLNTLRASMPMLHADSAWTMRVLLFLLLITVGIVVYLMYSDNHRKKNRGPRSRHVVKRNAIQVLIEDFLSMFDRNPPPHGGSASIDRADDDVGLEDTSHANTGSGNTDSSNTNQVNPWWTILFHFSYTFCVVLYSIALFIVHQCVVVVYAAFELLNQLLTLLVDFYYSTQGASADVPPILLASSASHDSVPKTNKTGKSASNAIPTVPVAKNLEPASAVESHNAQGAGELMAILGTVLNHLARHIYSSIVGQFGGTKESINETAEPVVDAVASTVVDDINVLTHSAAELSIEDKIPTKAALSKGSKTKKMSVSFSSTTAPPEAAANITKSVRVQPTSNASHSNKKHGKNGKHQELLPESTVSNIPTVDADPEVDSFYAVFDAVPKKAVVEEVAPIVKTKSTSAAVKPQPLKPVKASVVSAPAKTAPTPTISVLKPPVRVAAPVVSTESMTTNANRTKNVNSAVSAPVTPAVPSIDVTAKPPITITQLIDTALVKKAVSLPNTPANTLTPTFTFATPQTSATVPELLTNAPVTSSVTATKSGIVNGVLPPPPPLRSAVKSSPEVSNVLKESPTIVVTNVAAAPGLSNANTVSSVDVPKSSIFGSVSTDSFGSFGFPSAAFASNIQAPVQLPVLSIKPPAVLGPPPGMAALPSTNHAAYSNNTSSNFMSPTLPLVVTPLVPKWSGVVETIPVQPQPSSHSPFDDEADYDDFAFSSMSSFVDGLDYAPVASPVAVTSSKMSYDRAVDPDLLRQSFSRPETVRGPPAKKYENDLQSPDATANITLEAMYTGLSPDAPSFRPGALYQTSLMTQYAPYQQHYIGGEDSNSLYYGHGQQTREEEDEMYSAMLSEMDHVADYISDGDDD